MVYLILLRVSENFNKYIVINIKEYLIKVVNNINTLNFSDFFGKADSRYWLFLNNV